MTTGFQRRVVDLISWLSMVLSFTYSHPTEEEIIQVELGSNVQSLSFSDGSICGLDDGSRAFLNDQLTLTCFQSVL